jgi:hypothetical protein
MSIKSEHKVNEHNDVVPSVLYYFVHILWPGWETPCPDTEKLTYEMLLIYYYIILLGYSKIILILVVVKIVKLSYFGSTFNETKIQRNSL